MTTAETAATAAPQQERKWDVMEMLGGAGSPTSAVFAGGAGVAVMGVALGAARSSSRLVTNVLRRQFTTTLEVTSKDAAYPWILHWLKSGKRRLRHVSVATLEKNAFELVPSPGRHLSFFRGTPLLVDRAREYGTVNTSSGTPWERVTLTAPVLPQFGTARSEEPSFFVELLETARAQCEAARRDDETVLMTCWGTEWRPFGQPRRKRPLESVVLAEGVAESVVADVSDWIRSGEWYRSRGVPYRRGYLLHGPPGGGKTSFVLAVAAAFQFDVCLLSLSEDSLTDDRLALALANVPAHALVLLEDVDAAFVSRTSTSKKQTSHSSLTLSGLLNALDGAAACEGRLIFMTTNFLERLDHALLRPGRVDVVKFLGFADAAQASRLFRQFYQEESSERSDLFAEAAVAALLRRVGRQPSMAELQAFLIEHKHDPDAAVRGASAVADVALDRRSPPAKNKESDDDDGEDESPVVSRGRRVLTAVEVDKLPWNPQPGWEDLLATPDPATGKLEPPSSSASGGRY